MFIYYWKITHLSGLSNTLDIKANYSKTPLSLSDILFIDHQLNPGHTCFLIVTKPSLIHSSPGASSVHYFQQGQVTKLQLCNWSAANSFGDVGGYWSGRRLHGR